MMRDNRQRAQNTRGTSGPGGGGGGGECLGRLRHQAALIVFALQVLASLLSCNFGVAAAAAAPDLALDADVEAVPTVEAAVAGGDDRSVGEVTTTPAALFSPEWAADFGTGEPGCDLARGSFIWRGSGFGSNVNNLLNAWMYAIAVEGWIDVAVLIDDRQMTRVECGEKNPGNDTTAGWGCLFLPIPHLCTFETDEAWEAHMVSNHVERKDLGEAAKLTQRTVRAHPEHIEAALDGSTIDYFGAKAAMTKYLWSYMTPWLQADIDVVARAPDSDVFEKSPFLALHVRRGDKIKTHEADVHLCEEYLSAAVAYLEGEESQLNVEDIRGIWVASDDGGVVERVKEIAQSFLPNVSNSTIFWAAGGVERGPEISRTVTTTYQETYGGFVYLFADLHQCTRADVFVGTFSSNMGRLLALLRESIGLKGRSSAISIDEPWTPKRRRQRRALAA